MDKLKAIGLKFRNKVILLTTIINLVGIAVQLDLISVDTSTKFITGVTAVCSIAAQIGILTDSTKAE